MIMQNLTGNKTQDASCLVLSNEKEGISQWIMHILSRIFIGIIKKITSVSVSSSSLTEIHQNIFYLLSI